VPTVLVATDADEVFDEIDAALGTRDGHVVQVRAGSDVRAAVIEHEPDLVVLDLQIGSMGGMATCMDLRLEEGAGRIDEQRILMLLDRDADVFLAERSDADGWLIKPMDAGRIHRAAAAVLEGESYTEYPTATP